MIRRRAFTLPMAALALSAAPASAQTGGTEAQAPVAGTGGAVASVSDGTFNVSARQDTVLGRTAAFRGTVPSSEAGRRLVVERFDLKTQTWLETATTTVQRDGAFVARWKTHTIGRFRVRARLDGSGATAASSSPELAVTVYRPAIATWYGPGFYGRRTACGQRMTRALVGVAHRTLGCGTMVAVMYKGRTLTVPVVDRGPFRRTVDWDLTAATAQALGFQHTDRIGAVRLRETAQPAAT